MSEPNYTSKHISEDIIIKEMKKVWVKINKPIYLGQTILDISKTHMYELWYDYIKPKYGDNATALYMDTDSFVIFIKILLIMLKNDLIHLNGKVIGTFKDELEGKIMTEFCALRAKAYAYKLGDDTEHKKAKGTKKICNKKRAYV